MCHGHAIVVLGGTKQGKTERYTTMYTIEIHYTKYVVKLNGKVIGETTEYHKALDLCTNLSVKVKTIVVKGN